MIWEELILLEECDSESAAESILTKIAQRGRITEITRPPQYLFTIEYMENKVIQRFRTVAEGWHWKDRHKIFTITKASGEKLEVASFYCPKETFIQQTSRLCNM